MRVGGVIFEQLTYRSYRKNFLVIVSYLKNQYEVMMIDK